MFLPEWRDIPPGWVDSELPGPIFMWENPKRNLRVAASIEEHAEHPWIHVSISHPKRIPNYLELQYLRHHWIGQRKSIMVFPTEEYYTNLHENCLHLYANLNADDDPLPEFSLPAPAATQGNTRGRN